MIKNNRILIIDDNSGIRESYRNMLSPDPVENIMDRNAFLCVEQRHKFKDNTSNFDLTLVESGEKGVEAVEKAVKQDKPFAAAFIDMKMPSINEAETLKRIWATAPDIKIVIVTASDKFTPNDIIQVTDKDDIYYLRKPFNPEEIRQLARALANQWNLEWEKKQLSVKLKKANQELEDINKNLQKKVEEQTVLLVQSQKMAYLGILVAGVAHEINNPISFVSGNMSAIKKYCVRIRNFLQKYKDVEDCFRRNKTDKLTLLFEEIRKLSQEQQIEFIMEDIVDLADESLEGINRVSDIVKDLKTFSRIDQVELKSIDLNKLIDTTLNIIWNKLKYKVKIIKKYGELPEVKCFPQKISQVFMNILINAAQAIEEKGIVKIVTRYVKKGLRSDDEYVEIRISDTGQGISQNDISKIFDPFFTTKPVGQGTGLGLSISYDIIHRHGGEIKVESEKGTGSTFIICLPLNRKPHCDGQLFQGRYPVKSLP